MGTRGGRPEPRSAAPRVPAQQARKQQGRQGSRGPVGGPARPASARAAAAAKGAAAGDGPGPAAEHPGAGVPPRWFQLTTLALAVAGLAVSVYLTYAHYTESALAACPENATINCAKVTTSPESMVFGIFPVAVLGLAFYLFMTAVTMPWAWRAPWPALRWARLGSVIVGIGFVLYLIYVELLVVNAICLWCTSVHVITFVLFALIVASAAIWGLRSPAPGRG